MSRKIISIILSFCFIFQQTGLVQAAAVELNLSNYFARMASSMAVDNFRPIHLRYFSYDSLNNSFKVLLDKGTDPKQAEQQLKAEAKELLKYFLIGVTLPNDKFWVNLRPDSPKQIIDFNLEETDIGKIMLEADLQLKKDTAAFTSPQTPEGKEYWDRLYKKASEIYGTENITIPTLTRPWIVPNEIIVRETKDSAYIYKATLKVCLEQDYLRDGSLQENRPYAFKDERSKALNEYSSQLIRELIIPKLTKEVNLSKRYASLRQVYYSLILSRWFKSRFYGKSGVYASLIDKNDLTNLTSKSTWDKKTYFNEYKKSFAQGEYNIKEPVYTPTGQSIRSYFSGGIQILPKVIDNEGSFSLQSTSSPITRNVLPAFTLLGFLAMTAPASPDLNQIALEATRPANGVELVQGSRAEEAKDYIAEELGNYFKPELLRAGAGHIAEAILNKLVQAPRNPHLEPQGLAQAIYVSSKTEGRPSLLIWIGGDGEVRIMRGSFSKLVYPNSLTEQIRVFMLDELSEEALSPRAASPIEFNIKSLYPDKKGLERLETMRDNLAGNSLSNTINNDLYWDLRQQAYPYIRSEKEKNNGAWSFTPKIFWSEERRLVDSLEKFWGSGIYHPDLLMSRLVKAAEVIAHKAQEQNDQDIKLLERVARRNLQISPLPVKKISLQEKIFYLSALVFALPEGKKKEKYKTALLQYGHHLTDKNKWEDSLIAYAMLAMATGNRAYNDGARELFKKIAYVRRKDSAERRIATTKDKINKEIYRWSTLLNAIELIMDLDKGGYQLKQGRIESIERGFNSMATYSLEWLITAAALSLYKSTVSGNLKNPTYPAGAASPKEKASSAVSLINDYRDAIEELVAAKTKQDMDKTKEKTIGIISKMFDLMKNETEKQRMDMLQKMWEITHDPKYARKLSDARHEAAMQSLGSLDETVKKIFAGLKEHLKINLSGASSAVEVRVMPRNYALLVKLVTKDCKARLELLKDDTIAKVKELMNERLFKNTLKKSNAAEGEMEEIKRIFIRTGEPIEAYNYLDIARGINLLDVVITGAEISAEQKGLKEDEETAKKYINRINKIGNDFWVKLRQEINIVVAKLLEHNVSLSSKYRKGSTLPYINTPEGMVNVIQLLELPPQDLWHIRAEYIARLKERIVPLSYSKIADGREIQDFLTSFFKDLAQERIGSLNPPADEATAPGAASPKEKASSAVEEEGIIRRNLDRLEPGETRGALLQLLQELSQNRSKPGFSMEAWAHKARGILIREGILNPESKTNPTSSPLGGIDFKHQAMASATTYEAMGSFSGLDFSLPKLSSQALLSFNLDKEQADINRAIDNGIIVSGQRIKEFMAASFAKGELDNRRETVITWLAKLGILEETTCCTQESSKEYREALVIADSAVI